MKHKRLYAKPTMQVVEMVSGAVLLDTSAMLQGYQYQENTTEEGWTD